MPRPLLYEINTRCWLRELSQRAGKPIRLGNVPESEFASWKKCGFTHLWLMGVWSTGEKSRQQYLQNPQSIERLRKVLPDWRPEDVTGSPYAIAEYLVPDPLGGEDGLQRFRERLHQQGMQLVLDFVPNHVGLDHPWVQQRPELFVQSHHEEPETLRVETIAGARWLAHGKDPYFPAWNDTVQLDLRRSDTRAALISELQAIASRCDGVRCDMAMLALNDVFAQNWRKFPCPAQEPTDEFWLQAIGSIKRPGFLFIAEAYWDLESRLQSLGFDFTYDKRVTDFIVERRWPDLQRHLMGRGDGFRNRSLHFLENHDEPRIAGRLSKAEHRTAAFLTLTLPGMCLLHEGQLSGARIRVPVYVNRRPIEALDSETASFYEHLLQSLSRTAVGRGSGRLLRPHPTSPGDKSVENLLVIQWREGKRQFDLAVINPSHETSRCRIELPDIEPAELSWRVFDWLGDRSREFTMNSSRDREIILEVPPCEPQLLHFGRPHKRD